MTEQRVCASREELLRDDVFRKASLYGEDCPTARLTVNYSKLFEVVVIGMNRDPDELLNEVYGEAAG